MTGQYFYSLELQDEYSERNRKVYQLAGWSSLVEDLRVRYLLLNPTPTSENRASEKRATEKQASENRAP